METGAKRSKQIVTISTWLPKFSIETAGSLCIFIEGFFPREFCDLISTPISNPKTTLWQRGGFKKAYM